MNRERGSFRLGRGAISLFIINNNNNNNYYNINYGRQLKISTSES